MSIAIENEKVVAIMPAIVRTENDEAVLSRKVTSTELEAESIIIETDEDYNNAAEFGKRVKQEAANVISFFKDMKDDAYKAHKTICDREKQILKPLQNAEAILKRVMGEYALLKERKRKAAEAETRRLAQEEAERKLLEAIKLEKSGDSAAAECVMLDAEMADTMSRNVTITAEPPKVKGVSQTTDWELVSVDNDKVPIAVAGMVIRPVDEKAIMRLIRASKGKVSIPGIIYKETIKTSIRKS